MLKKPILYATPPATMKSLGFANLQKGALAM